MSEENANHIRFKIGFWTGTIGIWFVTTFLIGWVLNFSTLWNIGVVLSGGALIAAISRWDLHKPE